MTTSTQPQILSGEFHSHGPAETFSLAEEFGARLRGGDVIFLHGPLGAGKTVFVKGLASGLQADPEEVTSPSFTLVNPYAGRLPLFHLDLYRLDEGAAAAHAVDLEELLSDEGAVIVIEWAERLGNYPIRTAVWHVQISGDGDAERTITIWQKPDRQGGI